MSQKPKKKKSVKKSLSFNIIDWLFIIVAVITAIFVLVTDHDHSPLYIIADIIALVTGAIYMVLSVKGYRSNFVFSFFSIIAFAYIAWCNQFYGSMAFSIFCYIPCILIGFYLWGKHSNKNHEVRARKLTPTKIVTVIAAIIISTFILKFYLDAIGGASTILDSATVTTSLIANLLVVLRYREQWLVWLLADAIQLVMWTVTNDPVMPVMRILYPLSAIYGYIYWRKLLKHPHNSRRR